MQLMWGRSVEPDIPMVEGGDVAHVPVWATERDARFSRAEDEVLLAQALATSRVVAEEEERRRAQRHETAEQEEQSLLAEALEASRVAAQEAANVCAQLDDNDDAELQAAVRNSLKSLVRASHSSAAVCGDRDDEAGIGLEPETFLMSTLGPVSPRSKEAQMAMTLDPFAVAPDALDMWWGEENEGEGHERSEA